MESTPLEYVYEIGMILAALAAGGSAWLGRGHVERRRNGHAPPPDDAALGLLEVTKPATTATNYNVCVEAVFD